MGLFSVGDLVWARMKNNPPWPARITHPPSHIKKIKNTRNKLCVYFFGTKNFAWLHVKNLDCYSPWEPSRPYPKKKLFSRAIEEAEIYQRELEDELEEEAFLNGSPSYDSEDRFENSQQSTPPKKRRPLCPDFDSPQKKPVLKDDVADSAPEIEIGFIGMGVMGSQIVHAFLQQSRSVIFWNRSIEKCDQFCKFNGGFLGFSPCDVANRCKVLFVCVSDDEAVDFVNNCDCGIFTADLSGKTYVQLSNVSVECSKETAKRVNNCNGTYLEAQMIGNYTSIETKNLVLPVAGCDKAYLHACELFDIFCAGRLFVGDVGNAITLRWLVSLIMGTMTAALAEGAALMKKCSLSLESLYMILDGMPLSSLFFIERNLLLLGKQDIYTFVSVSRIHSDLKEILRMCESQSQTALMTTMTNETLKKAMHEGKGDKDIILGLAPSN